LALDCRVAVVTSAAGDLDMTASLSGSQLFRVPAKETTTFENIYTPAGRQQILHAVAAPLDLTAVPQAWRRPEIVHLAPVAGECDPALAGAFPGALVCVTPQGWMRGWDAEGHVHVQDWPGAKALLPQVSAAVISREDVGGDAERIRRLARLAPILVVTLGPQGCDVYVDGHKRHVPVTLADEVDATGAGDIFATAFFVRLYQCRDPVLAARFANRVAALSVGAVGWRGTPTSQAVAQAMREVSR
jgi:sugar/nucleoside kinase (ribokinase family)